MSENTGERNTVRIDPELEDLIPGYLENRHKDINSIREALGKGDYDVVQRLGHSMKGSGGGYGFDDITNIGKFLEQAAKDRDSEGIRKFVSELKTYLDYVEVGYE